MFKNLSDSLKKQQLDRGKHHVDREKLKEKELSLMQDQQCIMRCRKECKDKVAALENKVIQYKKIAGHHLCQFEDLKTSVALKNCYWCEDNRKHVARYKGERDLTRTELIELGKVNQELKINNQELTDSNQELQDNNQTLRNGIQTLYLNYKEDMGKKDIEIRLLTQENESLKERLTDESKDANVAILHYQAEEEKYKTLTETKHSEISDLTTKLQRTRNEKDEVLSKLQKFLIEIPKLQNKLQNAESEKQELLARLQKQNNSSDKETQKFKVVIEDLKKRLKENGKQHEQFDHLMSEMKKLKEVERKYKTLLNQRDEDDLKKEQTLKTKFAKENESLKNKIKDLERQLAAVDELKRHYNKGMDRIQQERDHLNRKMESLKNEMIESTARHNEEQEIAKAKRSQLEKNIRDLEIQLSDLRFKSQEATRSVTIDLEYREQIDKKNEEIVLLNRKLKTAGEGFATWGGKSDTEKENASLQKEVTEAVKNLVKQREDFKDLEYQYNVDRNVSEGIVQNLKQEKEHLEVEKNKLNILLKHVQTELDALKNQQTRQQDSSHGKMENLFEKNRKLEEDKELMRQNIYSLKNENVELQERSERLESEMTCLEKLRSENEGLKVSLAVVKSELEDYEEKYRTETAIRISTDGITKQNQDENDRLRKERNLARNELHRVLREKEDISKHLYDEVNTAKAEIETKDREKTELLNLFKTEKGRLEREIETLKSRLVAGAAQHSAYELMQLKNDLETCKLQKKSVEDERDDLQKDITELEKQLHSRSMNSSLQGLEDERNTDNLKKQIQDFEDRYKHATTKLHEAEKKIQDLNEIIKEQKEKNRDVNVKLNKSEKEKKDLENQLRFSGSQLQVELDRKKEELDVLRGRLLTDEEKLVQSKIEKTTLQRENEDLKHTLDNLSQQLQQSEKRFHELLDSKHSSQVLQTKVKDLQEDISELNKRLKISKDETSSLQKNNAELEKLLQENSKQLKSSEARFRDIAGSIENTEVLQRRINTLELDMSQLNKKLSVIKDENLTLQKDNKDLKNRFQEKSRQLKTAEERLQENSAEFEGIPSLKRRLENLQIDNTELENRCKHKDSSLQKADLNAQKMKKDYQQLQTQMISQKQNYDTLNNRLESLKDKNLELEDRLRRRSPVVVADPKNCQNCWKYRNDISDLKREINDLRDRLSEAAGNKLRDNNPNIADLSDMNRPTSLAEKFSSLYTDEYTDAMEVIEDDMDEAASVKVMLDWLKRCYEWCQRLAQEQRETLINRSIGFMEDHGGQKVQLSDRCLIFVKEFQKKIAVESLVVVGQICHVKSVTQQTLSSENYIVKYIKKCSELCWMMQISDPPLYLNFDVNSGENLNKNDYNVFTKSGSKIDYLVWPVLYLHKTGPMLAKGVAQGK
ncbi:unnamed protein product [Mytilus coruscus]|uniref:Mitochondria-eating protein C-terminal domain-containing protein n=1 Tax=Mytilus coruscus TaxID=42192 RepID=A0A6J8C763_MYTCO|nr:unnamed protein product [Mytilus coruscus]